nr:MAG: putative capsid protein [Canine stool-associated circular virus]
MAGYRFRSRRAYRRYGWYSKSRSSRRRAIGNARAGRQQRDAATVTISRIASVAISIPAAGQTPNTAPPGYGTIPDVYWNVATINHWNQLRQSTYFNNYAPMYDQMKIDKIRMKVTGSQSGTSITSNISPAVVLAFDRNGLDESQIASGTNYPLTTATVSTYSSAQMKQWSTGNAFTMYQTIYPSTIMEKGQYVPTNSLEAPSTEVEGTNPCALLSDATLPFKPTSLLGVTLGGTNLDAVQTFSFTIEYEYTVTFRGMRKPSLAYSDDFSPLSVNVTDSDVTNGELYYDDGPYNPVSVNLSNITPQPQYIQFQDTITQNGTYDQIIPQGQAVNRVSITVNVPTTKATLTGFLQDADKPSTFHPFSDFGYNTTETSISIPIRTYFCIIEDDFLNQDVENYRIYIDANKTSNVLSLSVNPPFYYFISSYTEVGGPDLQNYLAIDANTPTISTDLSYVTVAKSFVSGLRQE